MISVYVFFEITIICLLVMNNIIFNNVVIINLLKLSAILMNVLMSANKKFDKNLRNAVITALIANICFIVLNNCALGIASFITVQVYYYMHLNKSQNKVLIIGSVINFIIVLFFQYKLLIFEAMIYLAFIILNICKAFKLGNEQEDIKWIRNSLIFLMICDICILLRYLMNFNINIDNIIDSIEWGFYIFSQMLIVIYALKETKSYIYKVLQPIFTFIFKVYYNPKILNKEYIPKNDAAVIAGNHKHALDPILVDVCTKRVVHTLAKKDLHDGKFGWFFSAIGTIPVDLKAERNKQALISAVEYLKQGELINVSPEAKRNYTSEVLLPFKPGAVVMSQRAECKIIPYSITGDYKFRSNNLKITFGKPLDVKEFNVDDANNLLYNKVKELIT